MAGRITTEEPGGRYSSGFGGGSDQRGPWVVPYEDWAPGELVDLGSQRQACIDRQLDQLRRQGLVLVIITRWKPFDPLVAIVVALNILWSGGHLIWRSAQGLLDYSDPEAWHEIREKLDAICSRLGVSYHGVRFRATGYRQLIEVHLLFPRDTPLGKAHQIATEVEERVPTQLTMPA